VLGSIPRCSTKVFPSHLTVRHPAASGSLAFDLMTEAGQTYTVEYADTLPSGNWQTLTTITGDGTIMTVSDPASLASRFYRVRTP
jgi:hypothetical protein